MAKIDRFYTGDRVRVSEENSWAQSATGVIKENPRPGNYNKDWKGCPRTAHGPIGPLFFYWVEFDSPQKAFHSHESTKEGEIEARFLVKIAAGS
jgi:hypothetical protein